jgi:hypothetical protein
LGIGVSIRENDDEKRNQWDKFFHLILRSNRKIMNFKLK